MFKANQANRTPKTDDSKVIISSEFKELLLSEIAQIDGNKLLTIKNNVAQDVVLTTAFDYFFAKDNSLENLELFTFILTCINLPFQFENYSKTKLIFLYRNVKFDLLKQTKLLLYMILQNFQ